MKKNYETPKVLVQEFEVDEYIAACWGVKCYTDDANNWEKDHFNYNYPDLWHDPDSCGKSSHQVLYDDDNNGSPDRMMEVDTKGLGTLQCYLYTDDTYKTPKLYESVHSGETIYWITKAGKKTWHHQGYVYDTVPGHPNRS